MTVNVEMLLCEPVWMAWCKQNKAHLDKLVEMYYINPSNVMRQITELYPGMQYAELSEMIVAIEATSNELEKPDGI